MVTITKTVTCLSGSSGNISLLSHSILYMSSSSLFFLFSGKAEDVERGEEKGFDVIGA